MPSQRKKGKKMIGGYVSGEFYEEFAEIAKAEGKPIKQLMEEMLFDGLKRRRRRAPKSK